MELLLFGSNCGIADKVMVIAEKIQKPIAKRRAVQVLKLYSFFLLTTNPFRRKADPQFELYTNTS